MLCWLLWQYLMTAALENASLKHTKLNWWFQSYLILAWKGIYVFQPKNAILRQHFQLKKITRNGN